MVPLRQDIRALNCTRAKEVQLLFPNLGLYSGIFAIYLQHTLAQNTGKSRTASIIFYALCVLYVLSTVNVVLDLVGIITGLVS